ncbi:MAG: OmpA family protein [Cytophagaceae bacterium]|jgi:outer membrane protein OmpA-like peptidoglycan-associated protein|nr:OmpA family protein [Cytophagaceae bacterium]
MTPKTTFRFRNFTAAILLLCSSILAAQQTVQNTDTAAAIPADTSGTGQKWHRHEFSIYGGGGLSTLLYKVTAGDHKNGLGGHFGLGYHFFFNPKWGLGTGVEAAFYNARFLDDINIRYMTIDPEDTEFEFRSTVNGYDEKQRAVMLQIPLMVQYQTGKRHQFFAAAGAKLGLRLNDKYTSTNNYVQNSGYYAYENYEYTEQTFRGFGRFDGRKGSGGFDFGTAVLASAEAGIKWWLNDSWALYTGAYLDYGLNNIKPDYDANPFVQYNADNPSDFAVNSVITSGTAASKGINPLAAGIKLRLVFGKTCKKPQPAQQPAPEIPQEQPKEETPQQPVEEEPQQPVEEVVPQQPVEEEPQQPVEEEPQQPVEEPVVDDFDLIPVADYVISHAELSTVQKQKWDRNIEWLHRHPNAKVFIYGHTCNMGTAAVNERVGKHRAEQVKAYLLSQGIDPARILGTASKRDTEPLLPNDTEAHRKLNRRVELVPQ